MRPIVPSALLGLLWLAALPARSADCAPDPGAMARSAVMTQGFLQAHPDLHWRELGLQSWQQGRPADALVRFKRAAGYADKVSQSLVARMYREGVGTAADPVLAYIWMDLAAERGYRDLLLERERYWNRLDAAQQQRVRAEGPALYATYGDATAKPRMETAMRVERSRMTGSRTGWVSAMLQVELSDGPEAGWPIPGDDYYRTAYWDPAAYWCMQDQIWEQEFRGRSVEVGPLSPVQAPQR